MTDPRVFRLRVFHRWDPSSGVTRGCRLEMSPGILKVMELDDLNLEQRMAVEHDKGPLLVVAGAGTGKTQVITRRIAHLIRSGKAKPHQIMALTFTEKAAAEMEQRMVDLLGYLHDVELMTFNSFGEALIKRFSIDIGLSGDMQLLSEIQRNILVSDNLDSFELDYYAPVSRPDKYIANMLVYFSKLKNELVKPADYNQRVSELLDSAKTDEDRLEAKKHQELGRAYARYIELCRKRGFIDYDDQIGLAIEILERRPNIRKTLQQEIRYLLVDEFQDTNRAQNRLLELLTNHDRNLMVVGDDDQSIYRFRGAAISNILAFKDQFSDAKQIVLTQNYRSSQGILDASYHLIQNNNPERLEFRNQIDKHLLGQFEGAEPRVESFRDYESEARFIAQDTKKHLKAGVSASDVAVLVRKNSQGLMIKRAFERYGLPHRLIGQAQDLYQQPEIQYLLYLFRALANPNDSTSLYHLLAGEVFGFDVRLLRQVVDAASLRNISLEQAIRDGLFEVGEENSLHLLQWIDRWRGLLPDRSVGEVGFDFLETTGYVRRLVQDSDEKPELTLKLNHLNQFFKSLAEYERIAEDKSVVGYVDHLGGLMRAGETTDASDVDLMAEEVQILTVHRAKGLEFGVVYIFDLTRGNFPSREQGVGIEPPEGLIPIAQDDTDWNRREERRLMYVAMTRAKRELVMTFSADHGGRLLHKPSEFLSEIFDKEPASAERRALSGKLDQIELFRFEPSQVDLQPSFWQDDWLVLGVRQLDDYLKCPAEFRWKHILRVPERPTANLAYGNLLHSLVERFHRARLGGKTLELGELLAMLEAEWPKTGFVSAGIEERSLAQAKSAVAAFYNREIATVRLPAAVENSFNSKINEAKIIIKGRFDVVYDHETEGVEIRDYKTGGAGLTDEDSAIKRAKDSNQLTLYALAWRNMNDQIPTKLTLDFLDQGLVGSVAKTAKQLDRMAEKLVEVSDGIRAGRFEPGGSCFNCSHTNLYQ